MLLALVVILYGLPIPALSLETWEKQWGGEVHPFILFRAKNAGTVRARVRREPYRSWYRTIASRAERSFSIDFRKQQDNRVKAHFAMECAFVHFIRGDKKYANQATRILRHIQPKREGGPWGDSHLHENDTLVRMCIAYDLLYPYLADHPEANDRFRDRIFRLSKRHRETTLWWQHWHQNNHQTRHYGALCLGAMTVSEMDPSRTRRWFRFGKRWYDQSYAYQSVADGAWAEGPNYFEYSAKVHMIYQFALRHRFGIDPFQTGPVRRNHEWSLKIRMPDGRRPNYDDASLSYFPSHYLTSVYEGNAAAVYAWDWATMAARNWPGFDRVWAICLYDDTVKPKPPPYNPTLFMPRGGVAVFRSGWDRDAVYLLALGEHGAARVHGAGHEHPDNLSFILHAYGEMLALDGGYIKWDQRHRVNSHDNHNVILVDGRGADSSPLTAAMKKIDDDAYIRNCRTSEHFDFCEIVCNQQGVRKKRSIGFVDRAFFILFDELRPLEPPGAKKHSRDRKRRSEPMRRSDRRPSGDRKRSDDRKRSGEHKPHSYTLLLHGNGGGRSGGSFAMLREGARWSRKKASLDAVVLALGPLHFATRLDEHSFRHGRVRTHAVLKAIQSADKAVFLTLLLPTRPGENYSYTVDETEGGRRVRLLFRGNRYEITFDTTGFAARKGKRTLHRTCF
jgi:hypothetical protein